MAPPRGFDGLRAFAELVDGIGELVAAVAGAVMLADHYSGGALRRWAAAILSPAIVVAAPAEIPVRGVAREAERILREHNEKKKGGGEHGGDE